MNTAIAFIAVALETAKRHPKSAAAIGAAVAVAIVLIAI